MDSLLNQECVPPKKRFNYGMKRKCPSPCSSKKPKIDDDRIESEVQLTLLPDDVLLEILKKCDHHTLAQIRLTCPLFERLVQDFSLWRKVIFTVEPAQCGDLYFIYCNMNINTKILRVLGNGSTVLPSGWVRKVFQKSPNLELVSFTKQVLDASTITIDMFPLSLTTLDLSRSHMMHLPIERSYFKDLCRHLPNLKKLNLSNCSWFEPHSLMAISKCTKLEVLELADCEQVRDCLAYCGLSTRAGFPALITLDLRRCAISNSELVCFSSIKTLKNLYLENLRDGQHNMVFIDSALMMMCTYHHARIDGEIRVVQRVRLERLAIRYYPVTFATLCRLAEDSEALKFIDITGVGINKNGMERFRQLRPDVTLFDEYEDQAL